MAKGEAKRPRDNHAVFRNDLGLTAQESDDQWTQIKTSVHDILLHRNLVGRLHSSIREQTKIAIAKQLEVAHPETFFLLKPKSHRRDVIHRIFTYQMMKLRGRVRRSGARSPQQTPLPPETPREQVTPQKLTPVGPPRVESAMRESTVTPPAVEYPAVEPSPMEMFEDSVDEAFALGSVEAGFFAVELPEAEPLKMGTQPDTPKTVWHPAPAVIGHKEVVITVLAPSVPNFKSKLIKSHLLDDSRLSISKLFQILKEDGFHCIPEDHVVRDEFGHELASHRHLAVAFQNLSNEERLESQWLVLRKPLFLPVPIQD